MKLFLDDVRLVVDASYYCPKELVEYYNTGDWMIVRSYDEFTAWILENGLPESISFDHDLSYDHYTGDIKKSMEWEKTGYSCAQWLVQFCMHEQLPLPEFHVHSMNPVGAENISRYLNNYK